MSCPKNIKKFLWVFSYEGPHKLTPVHAEYSLFWILISRCQRCNSRIREMLHDDEMVRKGFDIEGMRGEGAKTRWGLGEEDIAKHMRRRNDTSKRRKTT